MLFGCSIPLRRHPASARRYKHRITFMNSFAFNVNSVSIELFEEDCVEQRVLSALRRLRCCFYLHTLLFYFTFGQRVPVWSIIVSQREEQRTPRGEFRRYFMLACCLSCMNTTGPPTPRIHWVCLPKRGARNSQRRVLKVFYVGLLFSLCELNRTPT